LNYTLEEFAVEEGLAYSKELSINHSNGHLPVV